jgi:hypothetical protein
LQCSTFDDCVNSPASDGPIFLCGRGVPASSMSAAGKPLLERGELPITQIPIPMARLFQMWQCLREGAKLFFCALALVAGLMVSGCGPALEGTLALNDFETDADLDRIHWSCHQLYALSVEHVTGGSRSLEMKLYPADYPGLALKLSHRDWRRHAAIALDIFNPQPEALEITVRIDDKTDYPEFEDRYNERFTVAPGATVVRIPLETLRTSGGERRRLDLSRVYRFMFFLVDNRELRTLFVDHIRLEAAQPG